MREIWKDDTGEGAYSSFKQRNERIFLPGIISCLSYEQ